MPINDVQERPLAAQTEPARRLAARMGSQATSIWQLDREAVRPFPPSPPLPTNKIEQIFRHEPERNSGRQIDDVWTVALLTLIFTAAIGLTNGWTFN